MNEELYLHTQDQLYGVDILTLETTQEKDSLFADVFFPFYLSGLTFRPVLRSIFLTSFRKFGYLRKNTLEKEFGQLVLLGFMSPLYTCSLSTSSSTTTLNGNLILEPASRLDAFSAYLNRTLLPGNAPGGTTGAQEVRPTRSSRTSVRPPQISYAHNR